MTTPPATIRRAVRADIPAILGMIRELADFENEPDAVHADEASLLATVNFADDPPATHAPGFPTAAEATPSRKAAHCFILVPGDGSAAPAGMALFFYNYSTWLATPGVYLEDLFVRPAFRRRGFATLLLGALAEEAGRVSAGKGRLEWSCLRWNEGALQFYEKIGGVRQEEWIGIRVEGAERLARVRDAAAKVQAL